MRCSQGVFCDFTKGITGVGFGYLQGDGIRLSYEDFLNNPMRAER